VGLATCLAILVVLRPSPWIGWPVVGVAVLFALYLLQQARRFTLRLRMDETGVLREGGGSGQTVPWQELRKLRLNYYPHGRKAAMGTLVLVLGSGRVRLKVDSTLDHFPTLLARAAAAARERSLELHPTTQNNLEQLGL
jgi:hypothetical protein